MRTRGIIIKTNILWVITSRMFHSRKKHTCTIMVNSVDIAYMNTRRGGCTNSGAPTDIGECWSNQTACLNPVPKSTSCKKASQAQLINVPLGRRPFLFVDWAMTSLSSLVGLWFVESTPPEYRDPRGHLYLTCFASPLFPQVAAEMDEPISKNQEVYLCFLEVPSTFYIIK